MHFARGCCDGIVNFCGAAASLPPGGSQGRSRAGALNACKGPLTGLDLHFLPRRGRKLRCCPRPAGDKQMPTGHLHWMGSGPFLDQNKRGGACLLFWVQLRNINPNRYYPQTRAQRQRVASEKEEQRSECALTFEKSRSKRYRACSDVVPLTGLEPVRSCLQRILSPRCLPFHHNGTYSQYTITNSPRRQVRAGPGSGCKGPGSCPGTSPVPGGSWPSWHPRSALRRSRTRCCRPSAPPDT